MNVELIKLVQSLIAERQQLNQLISEALDENRISDVDTAAIREKLAASAEKSAEIERLLLEEKD